MFFSPVLLEDGRRRGEDLKDLKGLDLHRHLCNVTGVFVGKPDEWDTRDKAW